MAIAPQRLGIGIRRHYTTEGVHPYDEVRWERRDARITNYRDGTVAFEQLGVEVPESWSVNATNILAQKYFRGTLGTAERERSLKQVADRVVDTITEWGIKDGYFIDDAEAETFNAELKYLIIHQKAAFNSPVWFNIGVQGVPQQGSACFILSVEDSMDSILNWYTEEGVIFKGGSGAGVNLSRIRSSHELLKGGGTASGPVSFMRGADASAGTIKSGGKTRRAAKMVILDADHPDMEDFVWCKAVEERKARVLRDAGFDMDLDGADSHSTQYQNANNSVRVTDEFMAAVLDDADWHLLARTDGTPVRTVKARDLFRQIAHAAWECADPGMQFDTTINAWHTAPNSGRINGWNPCTEYMHLDNSACNLASLNLMTYLTTTTPSTSRGSRPRSRSVFTGPGDPGGQRRLPDRGDRRELPPFPPAGDRLRQPRCAAHGQRPAVRLGRGPGLGRRHHRPHDRPRLRHLGPHGGPHGPFAGFHENAEPMLDVLRKHQGEAAKIDEDRCRPSCSRPPSTPGTRRWSWPSSMASQRPGQGAGADRHHRPADGLRHHRRRADLGLVKTKKLVGGGTMSIVNQTVPRALRQLGYGPDQVAEIIAYIDEHKTIVGAPTSAEDLPVFACSMGDNTIHYSGHVRMMGAVQPFISGAISKTVNLPEDATVEEVEQLHIDAWKPGIKAVAIYRDNCKVAQPLSTTKKEAVAATTAPPGPKPRPRTGAGGTWPSWRRHWPTNRHAPPSRWWSGPVRSACPAGASPRPSPSGWPTARATSPSASTRTAGRARSSSRSPSRVRPWPASWTPSPSRSASGSSTGSRWPPTCASTPT